MSEFSIVAPTGDGDGKFLLDGSGISLFTIAESGREVPLDRHGFISKDKPGHPRFTRVQVGSERVLFRLEGRNLAGVWLGVPADTRKTQEIEHALADALRARGYDL
ncbi:hypothetical protein ABE10_11445 [Bacillus toyonensis]|nr:hypothetical protein [Bacillus toyonensis]